MWPHVVLGIDAVNTSIGLNEQARTTKQPCSNARAMLLVGAHCALLVRVCTVELYTTALQRTTAHYSALQLYSIYTLQHSAPPFSHFVACRWTPSPWGPELRTTIAQWLLECCRGRFRAHTLLLAAFGSTRGGRARLFSCGSSNAAAAMSHQLIWRRHTHWACWRLIWRP